MWVSTRYPAISWANILTASLKFGQLDDVFVHEANREPRPHVVPAQTRKSSPIACVSCEMADR